MSHTDEQDKTLDDLQDDAFANLMWLRARVRSLRSGFDEASHLADKMAKETNILRDFLVQGDMLDERGREAVGILHDHITEAYIDLRVVIEEGQGAR